MARYFSFGRLVFALALLISGYIWLVPPAGLAPAAVGAAVLALPVITLWATGLIPEFVTALGFFVIAVVGGLAAPEVVFAGFSSAALWMVFAGVLLGSAVQVTGLGRRVVNTLAVRFPTSYFGLLAAMVAVAVVLSFLVPSSTGRMILLVPIAVALADRFDYRAGSSGQTGIVLAATFGSFLPGFAILPASVPNLVLIDASESNYGLMPIYSVYLLLHFPLLGLAKAALLPFVIAWLFPDRAPIAATAAADLPPMTGEERRLALVLAAALLFWLTDFLHHISPGWIGLTAAVVCLAPGAGMISPKKFADKVDIGPFIYVAGVLGLGAMVTTSGLGDALARGMLAVVDLQTASPTVVFAAVVLATTLLGMGTTLPAVPLIMTPLAAGIASAQGVGLEAVIMMQVVGFSTVILPYQSPPLMVGLSLARLPVRHAAKLCLSMAAITLLMLLPLDYGWWRLLGWLG